MMFMLLQDYGGVPADVPPMTKWTPEEVDAHITYQKDVNAELTERGEFVDARGLSAPELAKFVVWDESGTPVVTDGPFPESKELLAGYRIIDVESVERAIEIAAEGSAAPGPGGKPIKQRIEVREVMSAPIQH
ncbi:MAG: YciI family protein [Solirubrobacterales bacterium]